MYYYNYDQYCIESVVEIPKLSTMAVKAYDDTKIKILGLPLGQMTYRDKCSTSQKGHPIKGIDQLFIQADEETVPFINIDQPQFLELLKPRPIKYRVHILGLGDVGSHLLIGLKLLGGHIIESIGIYDLNPKQIERYAFEVNQIYTEVLGNTIKIEGITADQLFDCDVFVFTASAFIPPVGETHSDVRMAQLEANTKIIKNYAKQASLKKFKGIFAVVSDPVDLLCRKVYEECQTDEQGLKLENSLSNTQIFGFGLGVMHARARYYAMKEEEFSDYLKNGAIFGPHGKDLVVINSTTNYNEALSLDLTQQTIEANIRVRELGYKPYIAPAYSSAAMSLLAFLKGDDAHVASYLDGVFFGAKCRLTPLGVAYTQIPHDPQIKLRLQHTYEALKKYNAGGLE